jgi:hypothetical protein
MHLQEQSNDEVTNLFRGQDNIRKARGNNPFFGITVERAGIPENAIALKFISSDGEQRAIHYHDILSPMAFDGVSKISIATPRLSITIEGEDLGELFDYIIEHRVKWISEPQSSFVEVEEGKPSVKALTFEGLQ